jgi:REP element-mobilizing transposase RayT
MIQKSFFNSKSEFSKSRIAYGGDTRGRKKAFRPLDRKRPVHITLKSSHAKGRMSLLSHRLEVAKIIESRARQYQIKLHRFENMGNHVHILVSLKNSELIQKFLRVVTGLIARLVTEARRGRAFGKRFWDYLAYTRIVTSRKDFARMLHYLDKNEVERAVGPDGRRAIEGFDAIKREAARRKVSIELVMYERSGSGELDRTRDV